MPQLTKSIAMPMFVGIIDKETKFSSDPHFCITSVISESANNNNDDDRDNALNCDSLNRNIAIKEEPLDTFAIVENTELFLLNSTCDTIPSNNEPVNRTNNGGNNRATSSTTTYLCHRCRQVFGSRDLFEIHYR